MGYIYKLYTNIIKIVIFLKQKLYQVYKII